MDGHPPEHHDEQQPNSAVEEREIPEQPDDEDCPWCPGERTLTTRLEAGLKQVAGRRWPTVVHVTECEACGATRRMSVRLDRLKDDTDAVSGGWTDYPGQGSLEEHS